MAYGLKNSAADRIVAHLARHPNSTFTNGQLSHALGLVKSHVASTTHRLYLAGKIVRKDGFAGLPYQYAAVGK